jgi:hypothetical protein
MVAPEQTRIEAIDILLEVKKEIRDDTSFDWTSYENAEELRTDIDKYIENLKKGNLSLLDETYSHFLVTSTFQEHALQNGWVDTYMRLAGRFDKLYEELKKCQ